MIKFLHLKGKKTQEIKDELDSVYGEASPSFTTVKHWVAEYKRGRTSILDEERSGRPKTATTDEMVDLVHQTVMEDRRLTVKDIAEACGISSERVHKILHQDLDMRKLSARWVPRLLTIDQKRVRADMSKLNELKFELLPHPPYSPDLAPSDFFLFPNLKKFLGGKKYGSNAEVEDAVNQYFSGLDNQFFSDGLKGWEKRWTKCIELQGDYVEK